MHGADRLKAQQEALRTAVENNLRESWNPAKFSLFLRLTGEVGRLGFLVEMGTGELFHEMGVWPEIEAFLVKGAQDEAVTPDQQIMALDALAFADIRANSDRAVSWLDRTEALITAHDLGAEERLRVGMKRMNFLARNGDRRSAMRLITELTPVIEGLSLGHPRVFRYNVACAELALGDPNAAS